MESERKHLMFRDNNWHYVRRIPKRYSDIDDRGMIRVSLHTDSLEVARLRRDAMMESDTLYWASLAEAVDDEISEAAALARRNVAMRRYKAANLRALANGFSYRPVSDLAASADLEEIAARIRTVDTQDRGKKTEAEAKAAEAVLGGLAKPPVLVSEAFDIYCEEIASDQLVNKSEAQKALWRKTKKRGVQYFIDLIGDVPITSITREQAQQYYNWWRERLIPKPGQKALKGNTANRDVGNMRKLYGEYFKYIGDEERPNPFRNLSFAAKKAKGIVPPFEDDWVRNKILVPGLFAGVNEEAWHIMYALIETGCRHSEICNLLEDDIVLDKDAPFIRIRPTQNREIKSEASVREIPLVGVSLEAMKRYPKGFPRYRDKGDGLSALLMKAFRTRKLLPTPEHKIYSFRHSMEKRMLEAGLDHDLRLPLMGHTNKRPAYGDGGSMAFRRDELLKIVHPFPPGIFD